MKVSTVLDQIDIGSIALPVFQRGYVWNRKQVKEFMDSLYRRHPVGSFLVWLTRTKGAEVRGKGNITAGTVKLILDGQQRITSLYGIIRGKAPKFFDGNGNAFTGLFFNLESEEFEFYMQQKMHNNPLWIDISKFMQEGLGDTITDLMTCSDFVNKQKKYIKELTYIDGIKYIDFHIDDVTGEDKTVDIVVDIFNRVNSGGTKLSKGDLALAKICAAWSEARNKMKEKLAKWGKAGFEFKLEWLLRCINSILTGESLFIYLEDKSVEDFKKGLEIAEKRIDSILNLISSRLGLDHNRVLGSRYSFPVLIKYLENKNGNFDDSKERDKLLFWYIHTFLWGRYAGSTESILSQDLNQIKDFQNALDNLIELLRKNRGDLRLYPRDFKSWGKGSRFYPLLYMLTRVGHAQDLEFGIELKNHLLGKMNKLEVHHIFPKALLYKHDYDKSEVNSIANFMFLTKETNLLISDKNPEDYFEEFENKNPGVLESNWIPMDKNLWKVENYNQFLEKRRELLAASANDFLNSLYSGEIPELAIQPIFEKEEREIKFIPGHIESDEEEEMLLGCNIWMIEHGLPEGEMIYELCDKETGKSLAMLDLAWPEGIQEGYSKPVAILIDEGQEIERIVSKEGYVFFTDVESFKEYVSKEILGQNNDIKEAVDQF